MISYELYQLFINISLYTYTYIYKNTIIANERMTHVNEIFKYEISDKRTCSLSQFSGFKVQNFFEFKAIKF